MGELSTAQRVGAAGEQRIAVGARKADRAGLALDGEEADAAPSRPRPRSPTPRCVVHIGPQGHPPDWAGSPR